MKNTLGYKSQKSQVATVFERQVMPGWNAPQGVEIVHTMYAGKY